MHTVLTVGLLIHFVLRWSALIPLLGGFVGLIACVGAAAMSDAPAQPLPGMAWFCLVALAVGIAMEVAAFFVH